MELLSNNGSFNVNRLPSMTTTTEREKKRLNERHEKILMELVRQPGNTNCADCKATGPRWASHNLGVFLCISCAGIHRHLGTHVSRVKSISLDTWTPEQIQNMVNRGNLKMNQFFNPHPEKHPLPTDNKWMEKYIREKYEFREFMNPNDRALGKPDQLYAMGSGSISKQGVNALELPLRNPSLNQQPPIRINDHVEHTIEPLCFFNNNNEHQSNNNECKLHLQSTNEMNASDDEFGEFNDYRNFQHPKPSSLWEASCHPDTNISDHVTIFAGVPKNQHSCSSSVSNRESGPFIKASALNLKSQPTQYVSKSTMAPYFDEFDLLK